MKKRLQILIEFNIYDEDSIPARPVIPIGKMLQIKMLRWCSADGVLESFGKMLHIKLCNRCLVQQALAASLYDYH